MKFLRASSSARPTSPVQRIRNSAGKNARGPHSVGRARSLARFMILGIIALAGLAFYSGSSAAPFFHYSKNAASALVPNANSSSKSAAPDTVLGKGSLNKKGLEGYLLPAAKFSLWPQLVDETIATFAADCETPKSSFVLGETVCAKTDSVNLEFEGGRWVHWLREDLSIAHGGSGTTLITENPQFFSFTPDALGIWKVTIAETGDDSQTAIDFTVSPGPESIATYEATCNLAQDNFILPLSGSVTVCAKADPNFSGSRYIYWVDSQGAAVQTNVVTSTNPSATRMMTVAGNYWVYFSDSDGSLRSKHGFTVSDPQEPRVDLSVFKTKTSGDVFADGFISFVIDVSNRGPDTASTVTLTDAVPADTTFASLSRDSGPMFDCINDGVFTVCEIASLPSGATSSFTFIYHVNSGTPVGTVISNTASISSVPNTAEIHPPDNSSTASGTVLSGTPQGECTLDCPNDIVTTATTHGPEGGATVTFGAAEGFGTCGAITSEPASGSFFEIGTTTVVTTSATGGGACSFNVTVVDTAAPTISCPANITVTANSGASQAFVPNPSGTSSNPGSPTTTGDSPLVVTASREDGEGLTTSYPIGVTLITRIATDPSGRQATCTQRITVIDATPLTVTCPTNKTFNAPTGTCAYTATAAQIGTATKTPASATITSARSDGAALTDPYPAGQTAITWTATATDGRTTSCTQIITVNANDTTAPTLTEPDDLEVTTSTCIAVLDEELGIATATDNCSSVSITRTGVPPGFAFPIGTTTITYVATDASGNTTTHPQQVTVVADDPGRECLGPVSVWLGLKNSDDIGTKFDLLAEVFKNDIPIGSGQLNNVPGGGSGFNNAALRTISLALSGTEGDFTTGDKLSIRLSVRIAASSSHVGGTARLWFNDSAANSRLRATVGQTTGDYFLRKDINHIPVLFLDAATGSPRLTVDVTVNRNQNGNAFKPFGTWDKTF